MSKWLRRYEKTPTIFQMEELESGAASLAILFAYHNKHVPLVKLRIECGVSRDGSQVDHLCRVAKRYGFDISVHTFQLSGLRKIACPLIVRTSNNHYFVIEGFDDEFVYINDPAIGRKKLYQSDHLKQASYQIIQLKKGKQFVPSGHAFSYVKSLFGLLSGYETSILLTALCGIVSFVPAVMVPIFTKLFIDYYLVLEMSFLLQPILFGLLCVCVFYAGLRWLQRDITLRLYNKLAICQTTDFIWRIFQLPYHFFFQRHAGDIAFRINLNEAVSLSFSQIALKLFIDLIAIIFFGGIMLMFDVQLALVIFLIAAFNLLILAQMTRKRSDYNKLLIAEQSKYVGLATSSLSVMQTIKASGRERDFFSYVSGAYANASNVAQDMDLVTNSLRVMPNFIMGVVFVAIIVIGGLKVMNYDMTIGTLIAMQSLAVSFLLPLNALVENIGKIQDMFGALDKLKDIKDYSTLTNGLAHQTMPKQADSECVKGKVALDNVSFGYNINVKPILKNISFTLEPGEHVAILGTTGAGKSTIAKLIAGIYKEWTGAILIDDMKAEYFESQQLASSVVVVDQEPFIFRGTVYENLTMWDNSFADEQIIAAAKMACLHDDIIALQHGYEEMLQEGGTNISGGQKQRLEIARALLVNPKVIILDEATSNIDPIIEKTIMRNIFTLGCTTIVIAHRLNIIQRCDRIIVLDEGKIVQDGTQLELMAQKGLYKALLKEQYK